MSDDRQLRAWISELEQEHSALESAIQALQEAKAPDLFALRRIKKRKLQLKDTIARLRSQMIPDLNA